ncbi:MAG: type II toxin-antitoxin system death-on-curing family toxin [Deltaproteobacteria bacterium CG_4_10_14_0_2_um_filter_43_8]|nr:MAG: type II toxin-antitoxin system death-on-curing family toxin [Deltaproteobacteria bacterium CG11_big_fil_rev_8_21_14_0_20_42_23]PJA21082.1 MAG: type II toxin-antitoxin system death-on-curing family toxin [Deltaproteobacteria bacterium CG_4_10_14_0_2_um_filter_43_8]PJC63690.1 MAG: type II toxin-antitoxin system death-on-curing family toxin [Deltaproteobacteria bacterium CG_4_9_14_0_2_um_filter_42_21]
MAILYLTLEQAIETHRKTIEVSGGGTLQHLDMGKLESILKHIQNDDYYPSFEDKLTHLFFSANKFHCFADGNKRISIALCAQMLLLNGYLYCVSQFLRDMENISYHVAAGSIDKTLLHEIITAFIAEEMDNESLKLKILNALLGPTTRKKKTTS